ncbi:ubiquitinyl hydrolase 1 [Malassezia brasiliensis]|uniref:Ubiquitin carboxyl-terminal hydrolase n=1 Tax=Malassezia brasiliensis TaxID=1821822 RepID=A0AAF0DSJ1_9BASI|nr:ubiquitinyl hydrolase 1 [Malassezia brasiliensis]
MAKLVQHARPKGSRSRAPSVCSPVKAAKRAVDVDEAIKPGALLKTLLEDPVRFVSSQREELKAGMSLEAARAAHYEVVNDVAPEKTHARVSYASDDESLAQQEETSSSSAKASSAQPLYTPHLSTRFPRTQMRAAGLCNRGNTCYLNSVMQALLHTPPLAAALLTQTLPTLLGRYGVPHNAKQAAKAASSFNPMSALKDFFERAWQGGSATPSQFINNLRKFAKPLRPGRQEDAHEYLRLLLEALHQACISFPLEKLRPNDPLLSTTLVQDIFGGRLRSRVSCHSCRHNSDTFDPIMDLSLDVRKGINSVKQALDVFTAPESLSGTEKYKCESCKRRVDATKRFSIDAAPMALTVHLKRFGIFGNKINRPVSYGERLHLGKYMSERTKGLGDDDASPSTAGALQQYRLYAVVHHFGSGPNVGHYVASVRAPDGQWLRMDDAYITRLPKCPLDDPSAYVLFYLREPVALDVATASLVSHLSPEKRKLAASSPSPEKRKRVPKDRIPSFSLDDDAIGEPLERGEYESLVKSRRVAKSSDSSDEASVDNELPAVPRPDAEPRLVKQRDLKKRKKRRMALERDSGSPRKKRS